jgi:hypothetical protein
MVAVRPIAGEAGPPPLRIDPADCVTNAASSATFKEASLIVVERIRAFDNPSFRVKRQRADARTRYGHPAGRSGIVEWCLIYRGGRGKAQR